jgi:hypothetical protein
MVQVTSLFTLMCVMQPRLVLSQVQLQPVHASLRTSFQLLNGPGQNPRTCLPFHLTLQQPMPYCQLPLPLGFSHIERTQCPLSSLTSQWRVKQGFPTLPQTLCAPQAAPDSLLPHPLPPSFAPGMTFQSSFLLKKQKSTFHL